MISKSLILTASCIALLMSFSDADGQISKRSDVKPMIKVQTMIRWEIEKWPDGKIKKRTPYKGNSIHGTVEEFFTNGNPKSKIPYVENKIHGEKVDYWDINAVKVQSKTTYANGLKHGSMTTWHHNGNVLNERTYKNDRLEGMDIQYHPADSGKKAVERSWKDGLLEGETHYDTQGRTLSYIDYEAGKKHGSAVVYGFSGEERSREEWNRGALLSRVEYEHFHLAGGVKEIKQLQTFNNAHKLHGRCEYYSAPKKLEKILNYQGGVLHGECEFYDAAGKLLRTEIYVNGSKIKTTPVGVRKKPGR